MIFFDFVFTNICVSTCTGLTVTNFEITYVWRVDEVTPKTAARDAVEELHENPWSYDMVLTEVHAPAGIDGFNLLQYAGTDMDLPVVGKLVEIAS